MNFSMPLALWARLGERTKLIVVGVVAFIVGTFFGGHGTTASPNGRYVPWGNVAGEPALLDTQTGQIWVVDDGSHKFRKWAALPTWSL
jgi:hypothetical protein